MALSRNQKIALGVVGAGVVVGGAVWLSRRDTSTKASEEKKIPKGTFVPPDTLPPPPPPPPPSPGSVFEGGIPGTPLPPPVPEDPYPSSIPWEQLPQPERVAEGFMCPPGYILVRRGVLPDGSIGGCEGDEVWCIPPWGAVKRCDQSNVGTCGPGLVAQLRKNQAGGVDQVCRNVPAS